MRISDWSSDVCSSDLDLARGPGRLGDAVGLRHPEHDGIDAVTGAPQAGATAHLELLVEPITDVTPGPRVGVAGVAGTGAFPWRFRSEERRVGKECVRTGRYRGAPSHQKKKKTP